jgi:hypothetical protein
MRLRTFVVALLALALSACDDGVIGPTPPGDPGNPMTGSGNDDECPAPIASHALAFDGVDDHVTLGAAPQLGLTTLTIETWVRRDGAGTTYGTGVGGLQMVPIAGKGRGENDGSNLDCNYSFGFWGEVLGADFEDAATGLNHPVTGRRAIPIGEWHHVAATYDGTTWRLYVDGALDGAAATGGAEPRADSIQHFGVGTSFNSTGVAAGRLHGAIDELRVWNHARDEAQLAETMFAEVPAADGLVARLGLERTGEGSSDGAVATIEGALVIEDGPVLDGDVPPIATPMLPADGAAIAAPAELAVSVEDAEDGPLDVTFHMRSLTPNDDFTVVVLPDTQYYTVEARGLEEHFYAQTEWIRAHRAEYNIVAVIHNGDITDHGNTYEYEWRVADAAMSDLEVPEEGLEDGLPYGVAVGNHDSTPNGTPGQTALFNKYFGVERFAGRPYYGGHRGTTNDDNWFTFSAGGLDFVVVNPQYDTSPDAAVLAWARSIFEMHPNAFGILNSHYLIGSGATFGAQGQAIYQALKDVPNVQLMTCGHVSAEARRADTFEGHTIQTMLADYQGRDLGGGGYLRIWEFSPASGELTVRSYSPSLDKWETDENSEFTLQVDLRGAGGPFEEMATVDPSSGEARAMIEGLPPGLYEWYATVRDCSHEVRTAVERFTIDATRVSRPAGDRATDGDGPRDQPARRRRADQVTREQLWPATVVEGPAD